MSQVEQIDYNINKNYGKYRFGDNLDTYTTTNKIYLNENSIKDYRQYQEKVNEKLKTHTFDIGPYGIPKEEVYLTVNQQKYNNIKNKQNNANLPQINGPYYFQKEKNKVIEKMQKSPNSSASNAVFDNKYEYPKEDIKLDYKQTNHQIDLEQYPHKKLLNNKPPPHEVFEKKSFKKYTNNSQVLLGNDQNKYFNSVAKQQQNDVATPLKQYYDNVAKSEKLKQQKKQEEIEYLKQQIQQHEEEQKKMKISNIEIQHTSPHKYGEDNVGKTIQAQGQLRKIAQSQNQSPKQERYQNYNTQREVQHLGNSLPAIIPLKKQFSPDEQKQQIVHSQMNPYKKNYFLEQDKNIMPKQYQGIKSSYEYYNQQRKQFGQNDILYGKLNQYNSKKQASRYNSIPSNQSLEQNNYNKEQYQKNYSSQNNYGLEQQKKQEMIKKEIQTIRKPFLDDLISQQALKKYNQQSQLQNQWQYDYNFKKNQQGQSGLSYLQERQKQFNEAKKPSIPEASNEDNNDDVKSEFKNSNYFKK